MQRVGHEKDQVMTYPKEFLAFASSLLHLRRGRLGVAKA